MRNRLSLALGAIFGLCLAQALAQNSPRAEAAPSGGLLARVRSLEAAVKAHVPADRGHIRHGEIITPQKVTTIDGVSTYVWTIPRLKKGQVVTGVWFRTINMFGNLKDLRGFAVTPLPKPTNQVLISFAATKPDFGKLHIEVIAQWERAR